MKRQSLPFQNKRFNQFNSNNSQGSVNVEKPESVADVVDVVMLGSTAVQIRNSDESLLSNELMNYQHDCLPWLYDKS